MSELLDLTWIFALEGQREKKPQTSEVLVASCSVQEGSFQEAIKAWWYFFSSVRFDTVRVIALVEVTAIVSIFMHLAYLTFIWRPLELMIFNLFHVLCSMFSAYNFHGWMTMIKSVLVSSTDLKCVFLSIPHPLDEKEDAIPRFLSSVKSQLSSVGWKVSFRRHNSLQRAVNQITSLFTCASVCRKLCFRAVFSVLTNPVSKKSEIGNYLNDCSV